MDTAAPTQTQAHPSKRIVRFLVRRFVPDMDSNSALLPTDAWLKDTLKDLYKNNNPFRRSTRGILGFASLGLGAAVAGTIAAVVLFPAIIPMAVAGAAALGIVGFSAHKTQKFVGMFKSDVVPTLKETIGKKYLAFKTGELKAEWQRKQQAYRLKKDSEKKALAEAKAQEAARLAEVQKEQERKKPAPVSKPADAVAGKGADKKEGGIRGFGKRLLQDALKSVDDNRRALEKPPAHPHTQNQDAKNKNDAPKAP